MAIGTKIRNAFCGRSTSGRNDYYDNKGQAVNAFDAVLRQYNLAFVETEIVDFNGDEGHALVPIRDEYLRYVGHAMLSWHRMPSGRYEFTGYIC